MKCPWDPEEGIRFPRNWSCRQLWSVWPGCWEPNSDHALCKSRTHSWPLSHLSNLHYLVILRLNFTTSPKLVRNTLSSQTVLQLAVLLALGLQVYLTTQGKRIHSFVTPEPSRCRWSNVYTQDDEANNLRLVVKPAVLKEGTKNDAIQKASDTGNRCAVKPDTIRIL